MQIRQLLERAAEFLLSTDAQEAGAAVEGRELAVELAEVVSSIRVRLEEYTDLHSKGLMTEARHLATEHPPLIPAARALRSEALIRWGSYCADAGWPTFRVASPELIDYVERTFAANESSSDEREKLCRLYRRASLTNDTPRRLHVLRRLAEVDRERTFWAKDLRALETHRFQELAEECKVARRQRDLKALRRIETELSSTEWAQTLPPALVATVHSARHSVRRRGLQGLAEELAQSVQEGYLSMDGQAVSAALETWDRIAVDEDFSVDTSLQVQIDEAREWLERETTKAAETASFNQALSALETQLDSATNSAEIQDAIGRVAAFGRELPSTLIHRAEAAVDARRLAERRRSRLVTVSVVLVVLGALGAIAWTAQYAIESENRSAWLVRIDNALEEERWASADKLLVDFASAHPEAVQDPRYHEKRALVSRCLNELAAKSGEFERLLAEVQSLPDYQPFARAHQLLADAESLWVSEDQRLTWLKLRGRLREAEFAIQTSQDAAFVSEVEIVDGLLGVLSRTDCEASPEAYRTLLDSVAVRLPRVRTLANSAGNDLQGRLRDIEVSYRAAVAHQADTEQLMEERRRQLAQVYSTLPDVIAYCSAIETARARLDLPQSVSAQLETLHRTGAHYASLEMAADWEIDTTPVGLLKVERWLDRDDPRMELFSNSLQRVQRDLLQQTIGDEVKESITNALDVKIYRDLLQFRPTDPDTDQPGRVWYFLDPPSLSVTSNDGRYWFSGPMFDPYFALDRQSFLHTQDTIAPTLAPHAAFLRDSLSRLNDAESLDLPQRLWSEVLLVADEPDLNPIVAMVFAQQYLQGIARFNDPAFDRFSRLLENWAEFAEPIYWLSDDPEVEKRETAAKAALADLPSLSLDVSLWQLRRDLERASLNRRLRCVGQVQRSADGRFKILVPEWPLELWVMRQDGHLSIAAILSDGSYVSPAQAPDLFEGEPLFAPSGEAPRTDLLLHEITRARGLDAMSLETWDDWPDLWPVNCRTLRHDLVEESE